MPVLHLIATALMLGTQVPGKDRIELSQALKAFYFKMHEAPTASGVIVTGTGRDENRITFRIMRPNLFSMVGEGFSVTGDGKTMTMKVEGRAEPIRFRQSATSPDIYGFEALTTDTIPPYVKQGRISPSQFRGAPAYAIPILDERTASSGVTLFIDRKSLLPLGCIFSEQGKERSLAYEKVELGTRMERSEFASREHVSGE